MMAVGTAGTPDTSAGDGRSLVVVTACALTAPCVAAARAAVERSGFAVRVFEADGAGGRAMETLVRDGRVRGVLDLTTTELAGELLGGLGAGPDRLTAAGLRGVPQVIVPGAIDAAGFGSPAAVPAHLGSRHLHRDDPAVTRVRTTPEENDSLGKEIAHKASAARGPTAVLVPLRGFSSLDAPGQPFGWPEADAALCQSLRNWMSPAVRLVELDLHVNDPAFAEAAARTLLEFVAGCTFTGRG
jgi:uncharacterized protein (UPF0261 family)